jgi:hypothetical protein
VRVRLDVILDIILKLKSRYDTNLELSRVYLVAVVSAVAVVVSPLSCSVLSFLSCCMRNVLAFVLELLLLPSKSQSK